MQFSLLGLLILATPWVGSWKVELEKDKEAMHLVVKDTENVDVYDSSWTPNEMLEVGLKDDQIEIRARVLGSAQTFTVSGQRNQDVITGTMTLKYPQFSVTKKFKGQRVSNRPFPPPVDWIAQHRHDDRIDAFSFCLKRAPRDDFESFLRFWNEDVEPSFYIFLHEFLYAGDEEAKLNLLHQVFSGLQSCTPEGIELALKSTVPEDSDPAFESGKSPNEPVDCVVLIPALTSQSSTVKLSSIKNEVPPGVRPCCGSSLYDMEIFHILPVSCPTSAKQDPPVCGEDEPCNAEESGEPDNPDGENLTGSDTSTEESVKPTSNPSD